MASRIQNAESSERLRNQFGLKGHVGTSLDEIIVPTADVGDYAGKSPWEKRRVGGDSLTSVAGGAGRFSYVLITPGVSTKLVVENVRIINPTGVSQVLEVRLFRPADVLGTVTLTTRAGVWNEPISPAAFIPQLSAIERTIHHTTTAIGAIIARIYSHTSSHNLEWPLARGVVLDGSDPLGPISLGIMTTTVNQGTPYVDWQGSEYVVR